MNSVIAMTCLQTPKTGSIYLYDKATIRKALSDLKQIGAVKQFFYAMKANSNPEVLQTVFEAGA